MKTNKLGSIFLIFLLGVVYYFGLIVDVIDVDSAQYAAISMEMLQNDSYLKITERGLPYLDKPPLLFWLSTLSFKLFGFNNLAYKLPSFLFSLLAIGYTYQLGKYLYDKATGIFAALILMTSIGFIWVNMDVKTDVILLSTTIFAIYNLIKYIDQNDFIHLILGSVGIGLAMLAKGPLGIVMPIITIGGHLLLTKKWRHLFKVEWLVTLLIVSMMLMPMCWGLYTQFDMLPDQVVNGKTEVSGLRFYFWEQSFGRITGENVWKNNTSFFYLFHTALLLLMPWTFHLIIAFYKKIKSIFQTDENKEYYTVVGSFVTLLLLSFSSYKIPHYAIIVFPLLAILIASELTQVQDIKRFKVINAFWSILILGIAILCLFLFETSIYHKVFTLLIGFILIIVCKHSNTQTLKHSNSMKYSKIWIHLPIVVAAIGLGFIFNGLVLPAMQKYTLGKQLSNAIKAHNIPTEDIFFWNRNSRAAEFYLQKRIPEISGAAILSDNNDKDAWYFMSEDGRISLLEKGLIIKEEVEIDAYNINRIKMEFLLPSQRKNCLNTYYLIKFL